jgi:hypothetical protein
MWLTTWIQSYVEKFEIFIFIFTLDKSRDSELQSGISYTAFEEQWESNSASRVDQLTFEIITVECFGI